MLGNYAMAAHVVASRVVLSSTELVTYRPPRPIVGITLLYKNYCFPVSGFGAASFYPYTKAATILTEFAASLADISTKA
jgi:hypothetical protein